MLPEAEQAEVPADADRRGAELHRPPVGVDVRLVDQFERRTLAMLPVIASQGWETLAEARGHHDTDHD